MSNDNISHENDHDKQSKPTLFGNMLIILIEINRYQNRNANRRGKIDALDLRTRSCNTARN